jgi:phage terminase Nu1 subunit (DNA packaging protein)
MAAKRKPGPPAEHRFSRADLARELGISLPTVDSWRRRGLRDVGSAKAPRFLLRDVVEFEKTRSRESAEREDGAIDLDLLRRRRALADTELAELALEEAKGRVVATDLVEELLADVFARVRAKLLAFPSRYAARIAKLKSAPKVKGVLREATREVLTELAEDDAEDDAAVRRVVDGAIAEARERPPSVRKASRSTH